MESYLIIDIYFGYLLLVIWINYFSCTYTEITLGTCKIWRYENKDWAELLEAIRYIFPTELLMSDLYFHLQTAEEDISYSVAIFARFKHWMWNINRHMMHKFDSNFVIFLKLLYRIVFWVLQ